MSRSKNKVAIVTGAGRGIGRGIALAFAKAEIKVVLSSRSPEPIEKLRDEIEALGGEALAVCADVGDAEAIQGVVEASVDRFGTVDILVNSAQSWGPPDARMIGAPHSPPEELPEAWWDNSFETGVKATFRCCRAVFPQMRKDGGRIINMGSGSGVVGMRHMAEYAANKEAIRGLSRSLARSWGKYGITVNVICPAIETDATAWARENNPEATSDSHRPIPRLGDPEKDAGSLALFLASAGAAYLTGGTYMLDGGNIMLS